MAVGVLGVLDDPQGQPRDDPCRMDGIQADGKLWGSHGFDGLGDYAVGSADKTDPH